MRIMRKQRGWAGLLPIGLIAILGSGAVIAVVEEVTDAPEPRLVDVLTGQQRAREGEVKYEIEGATLLPAGMPEKGN